MKERPKLTILSFDALPTAAQDEQREDRSLNLALRRRGVQSEVFRILLGADRAQESLLAELIAGLPPHPLVFLVRDHVEHPLVLRLLSEALLRGKAEILVAASSPPQLVSEGAERVSFYQLRADDRGEIEVLAQELQQKSSFVDTLKDEHRAA